MNTKKIEELLKLIAQLPEGLRADWKGTNHYELQDTSIEGDFWWLCLGEFFSWDRVLKAYPEERDFSKTEYGQRIGLLMDIAVKAKEAEEELLLMCRMPRKAANHTKS